ncbi:TetR family transcriptional regulator [Mycolicibacterium madagascariense]|uniref:TetR family transcriptional regulator n=1 Tax=Mycolicibacterium madagascariense TaxID=212765 RepID=A0A7I7XHW8_9MYCO|nr:TetR family transcriptional regulator [Mycolicibacterium madagascariense]
MSKARIVATVVEILDAEGETALTFRSLAARLATGAGAIYWHVANKEELLTAATDDVVAGVMAGVTLDAGPRDVIRAIALGTFDAIDAHPWVGAQLARSPWQYAMLQIFEGLGGQLHRLGVPEDAQFAAGSALLNYVLGVAGQNAANARRVPPDTDRAAFLDDVADAWTRQDPAKYPFLHRIAGEMRDHDDREQFLAGIDLILAGIGTLGSPEPSPDGPAER